MRTVDQTTIRAPVERAFEAASQVERWPELLPHYRWVRFLERREGGGIVEMAAWRPFGPLRYPTWWVSEMTIDVRRREIRYRHVRGITRGMNVVWRFAQADQGVTATIVHRSEEHTSELQSQSNLVCRLLLEKKKKITHMTPDSRAPIQLPRDQRY